MAKDSTTEANDALSTTPLSVSFHDPSFNNFVNEVNVQTDMRYISRSKQQRNQLTEQNTGRGLQSNLHAPQNGLSQSGDMESFSGIHSTSNQTEMVAKASSMCSNTMDDNFDDFDDNFDDINPQEILDMVLEEEKLFATQQFMANTEVSLSQEVAEVRHVEALLSNTHAGPALTRSVPVTPSRTEPIYISDSDTPGRVSADEFAGVNLANKIKPATSAGGAHHPLTPKGRGNLYPRLARHIPQSRPVSGTSNAQPRPVPPTHSLVAQSDSGSRQQTSRRQLHLNQTSDYRHHRYRPPPLGPLTIDLNTSNLMSPSAIRHSPYSPMQPMSAREGGDIGIDAPSSSSIAEALEQLKVENARIRAESEQLRAQLYTKEGEVKIVRENLAKTEIDNTHLQERLANQIASSTSLHKELETKLREETERLKTELAFQQQEAQAAAMARTPVSNRSVASMQKKPARSTKTTSDIVSSNPASNAQRSLASAYPSIEDFVSTPTAASTRSPQVVESAKTIPFPFEEPAKDEDAKAENTELLRILTDIASQPSNTRFGFLVSVSIALSRAVRRPSTEDLDSFHKLVCINLCNSDSDSANYEQSAAVLQLLLRATDTLSEFRSAWLLDTSNGQPRRAGQVVLAISASLRKNIMFSAKIDPDHRRSEAASCGSVIRLQCKLLLGILGLPSVIDMINEETWPEINPFSLGNCLTLGLHMDGLQGILELSAVLIKESSFVWTYLHQKSDEYETFLLGSVARLRLAFASEDRLMIDGEHGFLVLVATTMMGPEDASAALINRMKTFARTMVVWFLEEHQALTSNSQHPTADLQRRVQVFYQYVICLKVVLSEISDVVELLDGDYSPMFFAFVAACTRMTVGEGVFSGDPSIRELAADLLAYVVTEEQALSIQNL
ncbi:hypothetical protein LPJ64_001393 [Coemansia asiatica]|uniref:Uncharacterized protein n=1 Tax=Coemansia asiatica TaxID=1052880 RepID=A0A9W7XP37_9FUNG|nr:hypothetical protein LPJ64_001393 [Coemansia asiatica]